MLRSFTHKFLGGSASGVQIATWVRPNGRIVKRTGDGVLIDASAGGARLHRAALEGLLSNATSRIAVHAAAAPDIIAPVKPPEPPNEEAR